MPEKASIRTPPTTYTSPQAKGAPFVMLAGTDAKLSFIPGSGVGVKGKKRGKKLAGDERSKTSNCEIIYCTCVGSWYSAKPECESEKANLESHRTGICVKPLAALKCGLTSNKTHRQSVREV